MDNAAIQETAIQVLKTTINEDPALFAKGYETGAQKATDDPKSGLYEIIDEMIPEFESFEGTADDLARLDRIHLLGMMLGAIATHSGRVGR